MRQGSLPFAVVAGAVIDFQRTDELLEKSTAPGLARGHEEPLADIEEESALPTRPTEVASDRVLRSATRGSAVTGEERAYSADTVRDFYDGYGSFLFQHGESASVAKTTVGVALRARDSSEWRKAITKEVMSLISGGTLVAEDPRLISVGAKFIHSTAQLKLKRHQDSSIDKYKCRLCACGNELFGQILETYSPTVSALAYAAVHQIAIIDRMAKCIVDVVQAYLYQDYPTDATPLYLTLSDNISDCCGLERGVCFRVRKYLYGLPDAGLAYYRAYAAHLEAGGYLRTVSDPCLFVKLQGSTRTYVWTHVDDTFVCSSDVRELSIFQAHCRKVFGITVSANTDEYLGIRLADQPNGDVLLTQPKLLKSLHDEFEPQLKSIVRVSAPQRQVADQDVDDTPMQQRDYLHLLGALIYLTKSRPDIATAVSFGATHAVSPTRGNFAELLHCLAYLWKTKERGLLLRAGVPGQPLVLRCYCDASYLTHQDSKSHTGFCMSFGKSGCFYSKSSKQTLVTTSSTHAELRALYTLTVNIVFLVNLCEELARPLSLPAIVMCDNQPVIDLISTAYVRSKRCKHFLMLVQWVKERVEYGYLELLKVPTTDNVADILMKIITGGEYTTKAHLLMG